MQRTVVFIFGFFCLTDSSFGNKNESCSVDDKCVIGECFVNSNAEKYCVCPDNYKGKYCEKHENDEGVCEENCSELSKNGFCTRIGQKSPYCSYIRKEKKESCLEHGKRGCNSNEVCLQFNLYSKNRFTCEKPVNFFTVPEKKCKNCKDGEMCKRVEYFVNYFAHSEFECIPIPLEQNSKGQVLTSNTNVIFITTAAVIIVVFIAAILFILNKRRQIMKRSQVHPHLIQRTNSDEPNNSYVTMESNVRPNSLPLNSPTTARTDNRTLENTANENLTQHQSSKDETHPYVNVAVGSNPYQNVFNQTNAQQDTDSMNSSLTKRNVSFSTSQKVHYYEAESSKKPKAGVWLKVQEEDENEVTDGSEVSEGSSYSSNTSTYEDEYIVTDKIFQNRELPGTRIRVSDVQSFSSDGDFY